MKELRTSMDLIRKTAGDFIENMTEQLHILQKEHSLEKHFQNRKHQGYLLKNTKEWNYLMYRHYL